MTTPGPNMLASFAAIQSCPRWRLWYAQQTPARRAWIAARMQACAADARSLLGAMSAEQESHGTHAGDAVIVQPWDELAQAV